MLFDKVNHRLYFDHCFLCREHCDSRMGICAGCYQDLPWLGHHCQRCALPLYSVEQTLCAHCLRQPPHFSQIQALFSYRFPLDRLISRIKYNRQANLLGPLAVMMQQQLRHLPRPDLLLPVPIHRHSFRQRGFNQAQLLAELLSKMLQIPCDRHSLRKRVATTQQMKLSREERRRNLSGAFSCAPLQARYVVLVDDVMTTGTTLDELARMLRQQGVERVDGWVLTRTPDASC